MEVVWGSPSLNGLVSRQANFLGDKNKLLSSTAVMAEIKWQSISQARNSCLFFIQVET